MIFSMGLLLALWGCALLTAAQETSAPPTQAAAAATDVPATGTPASPPGETPTPTQALAETAALPQAHQPARAIRLLSVAMQGELTGWGWNENALYRTEDGGATWAEVSPPGLPASQGWLSVFCLDERAAWIIVPDPQDYEKGLLFRTADGGVAWQSFPVPFGGGQFQFLDDRNGWALYVAGAAAGSAPADIYRTQDGGETWMKVYGIDPAREDPHGLPFSGMKNGLSFADDSHGWVTGAVPMEGYAWLYQTQDGGRTWQHQALALPDGYANAMLSIDPPRFFDPQHGLLPVLLSADSQAWIFFTTRDGGATWSATTPVAGGGSYDFVSPQEGWAWDGKTLHSTRDGGQTWTAQETNVDLSQMLTRLDFVNSAAGWALAMDADGQTCLYKTVNGGLTWASLCS